MLRGEKGNANGNQIVSVLHVIVGRGREGSTLFIRFSNFSEDCSSNQQCQSMVADSVSVFLFELVNVPADSALCSAVLRSSFNVADIGE